MKMGHVWEVGLDQNIRLIEYSIFNFEIRSVFFEIQTPGIPRETVLIRAWIWIAHEWTSWTSWFSSSGREDKGSVPNMRFETGLPQQYIKLEKSPEFCK